MSRSGYSDDYGCENLRELTMWRGAVASAIGGKRGQAFLREMLSCLDHLPNQGRLIADDLIRQGSRVYADVCAIGSVGVTRGLHMLDLDPSDRDQVAAAFGIAPALVAEIEYINDEGSYWTETPEQRFARVRDWVEAQIKEVGNGS